MRNLIILLISCFLLGCKNTDHPKYRVISYNSEASANSISEGDTLTAPSIIELNTSESMLLGDLTEELIYRVTGPAMLDLKEVKKGELESFNAKYFSLITDNLSKPTTEVRHAVLGGVSRGVGMAINYIEKENILSSSLEPLLSSHTDDKCDLKIYYEEEEIEGYDYNSNASIDLKDIRSPRENIELVLSGNCGHHIIERCVVILSDDAIRDLIREEARMIASKYPEEALLSFYLENKLFDKARKLGVSMTNKSSHVKRLLDIIND